MKTLVFIISFILISSSFQGDYDPNLSEELWKASSAAYQDSANLKGMNCGEVCDGMRGYKFSHQYTSPISKGESVSYSVFVNPEQKKVVFAFRGTDGNKQLMKEVLQSRATTYDLHNVPNAGATSYFYNKYKDNLRGDFMNQVKELSQQYPNSNFYFTGHSLGGALTTLGALDASMSKAVDKSKIHLYTYGSPRVGDSNLAKAVNDNVKDNYRVVHNKDIVPHVPPCITDFHGGCTPWQNHWNQNGHPVWNAYHTGTEVFYNDDKNPKNYRICSKPEDPSCSKQYKLLQLSVSDHGKYLGSTTETHPHPMVREVAHSSQPSHLHHLLHNLTQSQLKHLNHSSTHLSPQTQIRNPQQSSLLRPNYTQHTAHHPSLRNQTHPSHHIPPHSSHTIKNQTHKPHLQPKRSVQHSSQTNSTLIRPQTPTKSHTQPQPKTQPQTTKPTTQSHTKPLTKPNAQSYTSPYSLSHTKLSSSNHFTKPAASTPNSSTKPTPHNKIKTSTQSTPKSIHTQSKPISHQTNYGSSKLTSHKGASPTSHMSSYTSTPMRTPSYSSSSTQRSTSFRH